MLLLCPQGSSATQVAYDAQDQEYLATWLAPDGEIHGQRLSASGGELGDRFRISNATAGIGLAAEGAPAVAHDSWADEYLVVWASDQGGDEDTEIWGRRIGAGGVELGGDFQISNTGDASRDAFDPAVSYDERAGRYLVTWTADGGAVNDEFARYGQYVDGSGIPTGVDDFPLAGVP